MNMLEVEGLRKEYPAFTLQDVSFAVPQGAIVGFIGRNGAGKSTTLKSILGLVHRSGGAVRWCGQDVTDCEKTFKENIGVVLGGVNFYPKKKIRAITDVTKRFYPNWDEAKYQHYCKLFSLDAEKRVDQLSSGMKIKYLIALALSHNARLLILDEPTSGLDPVSREELVEVFLKLKDEGKTVFFSTHITSDLEKCADRILFLQQGELKADDTLEGFRDAWRIAECGTDIPPAMQEAACGRCRIRDGYTVLVRKEDAAAFETRESTLEEIMIHLEKEAEEA